MGLFDSIKHSWNSFISDEEEPPRPFSWTGGAVSTAPPDQLPPRINSERTIISSIYTRIAVDCSGVRIEHVRKDPDTDQYVETIKSGLNECLNVEANIDQAGRQIRQTMVYDLLSEGYIAILPVDTDLNPFDTGGWDVKTIRVGVIIDWRAREVKIRAWNDRLGKFQEIWLPKTIVGIARNPFYSVMNEPNSTLQRLVRKLSMLDNIDAISSQGKLDVIIQLPYVVKSETRKNQAEQRAKDIQNQLQGNTYGIAYTDGTEKITQLNRSVENNLLEQVKYLKTELYNELGVTAGVMDGTASDSEMLNYTNRIIEPVMDALTEAMIRVFLTKTARTQGQTLMYFQSPFKLIPISELKDLIDVVSRNQIASPNEIRPTLGLKPSKEPQANQLLNSNMPVDKQVTADQVVSDPAAVAPPDSADVAETNLDAQMAELGL